MKHIFKSHLKPKFTVLVSTCVIQTDSNGTDATVSIWRMHVEAPDPKKATDAVVKHLRYEIGVVGSAQDLNIIAVYPGHLYDLSGKPYDTIPV